MQQQKQQIHVKNNFQLFIPLGGGEARGFAFTQTTTPSFGLTLTKAEINESWHYQVQLLRCEDGTETIALDGLSWAKRSPYRFQTKANSTIIEGLYLQIKVEPGVFDFRRVKHNTIRFQINCFSGAGTLLSTGSSSMCKLLPKRRVAEDISGAEPEVVVPIQWAVTDLKHEPEQSSSEPSPNYYSSPYNDDDSIMLPANNNSDIEGNFEAFESPEHVLDIEKYLLDERHITQAPDYLHDEHFMVLYNGSAEVIGNFRALNFYKASDINIKEDIHLLSQDRNPRDVLMKIDGVEYKFKQGVRGNNDANRRFVGYIAQQIESVVPQAVQLIDGILHVDYESLIPYLSESIKQNFNDINNLNSKTDQIKQVVDMLYNEFIKKEQRKRKTTDRSVNGKHMEDFDVKTGSGPRRRLRWIVGISIATMLVISTLVGLLFVMPYFEKVHDTIPLSPISSPANPALSPISSPSPMYTPIYPPGPSSTSPISEPAAPPELAPMTPSSPVAEPVASPISPSEPSTQSPVAAPIFSPVSLPEPPLPFDPLAYERSVLEELYNVTNGPNWKNQGGWMTEASVCKWKGVTCNSDHRVQVLLLAGYGLQGTIPESLFGLDFVERLDLSLNKLSGSIPESIMKMKNLKILVLSDNSITGTVPDGLFLLPNLQTVDLSRNNFATWEIPASVSQLQTLKSILAAKTNLIGTIPQAFADLPNLAYIRFDGNQLQGTLPQFRSTAITWLSVLGNRLTGSISSIMSLKNLNTLDISNNNFTGEFNLPYESQESLSMLLIDHNSFTSFSPDLFNFTMTIASCNAASNKFQCPIPEWMSGVCHLPYCSSSTTVNKEERM